MFEHDLFISYSHIDNQVLRSDAEGWISGLHRALEVRLAQLLGRDVNLWRDPKLAGNDYFADEIVDKFGNVAALVSVLSPRYVKSEWCVRELEEFCRGCEATGGPRVGSKSRIFKVVKTPVARDSHPEMLRGLLGYDFFTVDPETERTREFGQSSGTEAERLYWAKLDDLAQDLAALLTALESGGVGATEAAAPAAEGRAIYLAETSFDLKAERDAIKRDLEMHGHRVLPARPLPLIASEVEAALPEELADCELSIHLMGKHYGLVPEGTDVSMVDLQNRLAVAAAEGGELERLIWIRPGLEVDDERQRTLLAALRTDPEAQGKTDVLETPLEDLKALIHRKLEPEPPSPNGHDEEPDSDDAPPLVYLVCDARDLDEVRPIEDHLYDLGYEVVLPVFDGDETQLRLDHQENLKLCQAVLIYYGAAKELWLRAKLRELRKIAGYGRAEPLRAKAILVAGPPERSKERVRTREAQVLDALAGFSPEVIQPFVAELGG